METVVIITRDINGKRIGHFSTWDDICDYINSKRESVEEEEILLVFVDERCIYSGLWNTVPLSWGDLLGFFA